MAALTFIPRLFTPVDRRATICAAVHTPPVGGAIFPHNARDHARAVGCEAEEASVSQDGSAAFWLAAEPLILASKSKGRRMALEQSGLPFLIHPAEIDERAIETEVVAAGGDADAVAARLARDKASLVSRARPGALVVGADQVASCEGRRFGKPATVAAAAEQLRYLSGRTHRLHSAIALARDGHIIFETLAHADLTMRAVSSEFLARYLDSFAEEATTSAGAYQIEGLGVHLFERVAGDHWTIVGLPMLPLLAALRREGALLS